MIDRTPDEAHADDAPRDPGPRLHRRSVVVERIWFASLTLIALAFLTSAGIVLASTHPDSCGVCHDAEFGSMIEGPHAELRCESCHAGTTVVGILESRIAVIDMVATMVVPGRNLTVSEAPTALCVECHEDGMSATVEIDGLRMNHRAPLAEGWECRSCHPHAGHEVRAAFGGYTMDMCLSCHTATPVNLASCTICHVVGVTRRASRETPSPWRLTHGPGWESMHGMGDSSTCGACHDNDYCVRCHGANVPHPASYLAAHGQDVLSRAAEQRRECFTCHEDDGCFGCHGVEMPHPDGFLQAHSEEMRAGESDLKETCARCHKAESCDSCHISHTHPGLSQERIDALRGRPVGVR